MVRPGTSDNAIRRAAAALCAVAAVSCGALWAAPIAGAAVPLLTNGSFETPVVSMSNETFSAPGSIEGWTIEAGSVDVTADQHLGGAVTAAGAQSVDLSGLQPGTIHQDLPTVAGARYRLSFAYSAGPGFVSAEGCTTDYALKRFDASWGATALGPYQADATGHDGATMDWRYAQYLVAAPTSTTRLRFHSLSPGACGMYLDDVSVAAAAAKETATALGSSAPSARWGEPVVLTAHVTTGDPVKPPAGAVQFRVDGSVLGALVSVDDSGEAKLTTSALPLGTHTIKAEFAPTGAGVDPSSAEITQTVTEADSSTDLVIEPDQSVAGQDVEFTATVSAAAPATGTPTGTVQFTESDGTPIGEPEPLAGGKATIVASAGAGTYTVRAHYGGDDHFRASEDSAVQTVQRAATKTTVTSSKNPSPAGDEVTFTATVETLSPGLATPNAWVYFFVDGKPISPMLPLDEIDDGTAEASVTVELPHAGSYAVSAYYGTDADTDSSTSAVLWQSVSALPATPTPAPTSQVPQSTLVAPVPATSRGALKAMTAKLTKALGRSGRRALTTTKERLTVAAPGTLRQRVTRSNGSTALLASGAHTFASTGTGAITLRLTAAGRAALRRPGDLRLRIETSFVPVQGSPVTVAQRVTFKAANR
ncbi:MAG: Ig-like domain repeat protein [Solirubrobacteraceae bacterium]|nr:Ig-like domain repeat protein [Solirubrobacteraceae bacterium]